MKEKYLNCKYMYSLIWKFDKSRFIWIVIVSIIHCLQILANTFFYEFVIDAILAKKTFMYFWVIIGIRVIIELIDRGIDYSTQLIIFPLEDNKVRQGFMTLLYEKIGTIDISAYDDKDFYDKLTRAIDEAYQRPIWMLDTLKRIVGISLNGVVLIISLAYLNWFAIVIAFIGGFVSLYCNYLSSGRHYDYLYEGTELGRKLGYIERIFYLIQYAKDVRTTKLKDHMIHILDDTMAKHNHLIKKYLPYAAYIQFFGTGIFSVLNLGVASIYMYMQILNDKITIGEYVTVMTAILALSTQILDFFSEVVKLNEHSLFVGNLMEILNYKSKLKYADKKLNPDFEKRDICLEHVSFSYLNSNHKEIDDVCMHIKAGQKIALVGENGAGKSTLLKLMMHLYEADEGCISIGGIPYSDIALEELYRSIAVVHQDFQAYALTIKENLTLYNQATTDEHEIKKALQQTNLLELVEGLPHQLDTMMTKEFSDDGVTLSGGQNQRLAIARALCSNASIIIMDEPSSALDPLAEKELFDMIDTQIPPSKTLIIVSHRLSGVKNMDNIYFMEEGRIVETGTHEELMDLNGKYAKMFLTQAKRYGV